MKIQPSIPRGTRDFFSEEIAKRQYITRTIEKHFLHFCFEQIQTPSFENLNNLMGNYGEEGDRLLFKILNSGDYLKNVTDEEYQTKNLKNIVHKIAKKGLRYDLTIPFSRFVKQHQSKLVFPFKRYQIQQVWRSDRPQKGRYREFMQCDADIVGVKSLWQEVELLTLIDAVFKDLQIAPIILISHRKILKSLAEVLKLENHVDEFIVILDKIHKIGIDGVEKELLKLNISNNSIKTLRNLLANDIKGNTEKITQLECLFFENETGKEGVRELKFVLNKLSPVNISLDVKIDMSLARGLRYYTGCIFEVLMPDDAFNFSIAGGGRYDNLTETNDVENFSGIGVSFGLDRIYLVLEHLFKFPKEITNTKSVLFLNLGDLGVKTAFQFMGKLRVKGLSVDLYPVESKIKKQMQYANQKKFLFVVLIGEEELKNNLCTIKNMTTGNQKTCPLERFESFIVQEMKSAKV